VGFTCSTHSLLPDSASKEDEEEDKAFTYTVTETSPEEENQLDGTVEVQVETPVLESGEVQVDDCVVDVELFCRTRTTDRVLSNTSLRPTESRT